MPSRFVGYPLRGCGRESEDAPKAGGGSRGSDRRAAGGDVGRGLSGSVVRQVYFRFFNLEESYLLQDRETITQLEDSGTSSKFLALKVSPCPRPLLQPRSPLALLQSPPSARFVPGLPTTHPH